MNRDLTKIHPAGLGRGSNPKSRQNLKKRPLYDTYVYGRGSGVGWTVIEGPMTYRQACKYAAALEAFNGTTTKPLYVAGKMA